MCWNVTAEASLQGPQAPDATWETPGVSFYKHNAPQNFFPCNFYNNLIYF